MLPANLNWEAQLTGDDPDEQVEATIEMMARYVREDASSIEVQQAAREASQSEADPIEGVFQYVKRLIRFQSDEHTAQPLESHLVKIGLGDYPVIEVLIRPRDMLSWQKDTGTRQVGDCDDFAMLTAALLIALGIDASFVTVAADPRQPNADSHVYVAAYQQGNRIPLDTSHGEYPGWEVQYVTRRREWPIKTGYRGLIIAGLVIWALLSNWSKFKTWKWRTS
jgi:Transglutaminase-like superfamily.